MRLEHWGYLENRRRWAPRGVKVVTAMMRSCAVVFSVAAIGLCRAAGLVVVNVSSDEHAVSPLYMGCHSDSGYGDTPTSANSRTV